MSDISIFIDTNVAQSFIKDNVLLAELGVPKEFYDLILFLDTNKLTSNVTVFFPEVVVKEMKAHMIKSYLSCAKKIEEDLNNYKKIFGDLISIDHSISVSREDYPNYVDSLFDEFFSNPRNVCKIAPFPHNEYLIETLLEKAIDGVRPFFAGKIGGKSHSDAGFKDSLIAETIFSHCDKETIGILISNDSDYGTLFENRLYKGSKFVLFHTFKDTIDALKQYYEIDAFYKVRREFEENSYLHERILEEADILMDSSVTDVSVENLSEKDGTYEVLISFTVNETVYRFTVIYDAVGNDIIECTYKIEND